MKLEKDIFNIQSKEQFERCALDIFRLQAQRCEPYKEYLRLIGTNPTQVTSIEQIPFLPIELYKSHKIYCSNENPELTFLSSGTTQMRQSHHYIGKAQLYIDSFTKGFEKFYSPLENTNIYALLPNYMENKDSSLLYMVKNMVERCADGDFFLNNYDELVKRLEGRDKTRHTLLFGVSFALWELAEKYKIDLSENITVMETGGMKGRRKEITREELHQILCSSFNTNHIHSEYGMCECLSQSYSNGNGIFYSPNWIRIIIRELNSPFKLKEHNQRGGINIIDLANIYSCSFIQTEDLGITLTDGAFRVEGRVDNCDIRGCNLMVD